MSEQSFSRPGAVDLSGLQGSVPSAGGGPGAGAQPHAAYTAEVTEQNFQEILESSRSAAVLLAFESPGRSPESVRLADDLQILSGEFEGRFLLGRVDIDANPQIAQQYQILSIPTMLVFQGGKPIKQVVGAKPKAALLAEFADVLA